MRLEPAGGRENIGKREHSRVRVEAKTIHFGGDSKVTVKHLQGDISRLELTVVGLFLADIKGSCKLVQPRTFVARGRGDRRRRENLLCVCQHI